MATHAEWMTWTIIAARAETLPVRAAIRRRLPPATTLCRADRRVEDGRQVVEDVIRDLIHGCMDGSMDG